MQTISVQCIWISISLLLVPQEGNIHCNFFIYIYFLHACSCALVTYIRNQYVCNLASRFQLVLPFRRKVNKRWLKFCPVHALNLTYHVIVAIHKAELGKTLLFFVNFKGPKIYNTLITVLTWWSKGVGSFIMVFKIIFINYYCVKIIKDFRNFRGCIVKKKYVLVCAVRCFQCC